LTSANETETGCERVDVPSEGPNVVWLGAAGDAVDLETAVLDALDERDERDAVEGVAPGCVSLDLARFRQAARPGGLRR
jgi:hypothetical protein